MTAVPAPEEVAGLSRTTLEMLYVDALSFFSSSSFSCYNWFERLTDRPKTTGLQISIMSVGQVADRCNIIILRSSGGTIFTKELEVGKSFLDALVDQKQDADGVRARIRRAC